MTRHKHLKIDQGTLDRARRYLGVKTESEAVELALGRVVADARIQRGIDRLGGVGFEYDDAFGEEAEIRRQSAKRR